MLNDPPTDEELIASIQRKDVQALEMLYDRHRIQAYSLALRMLNSPGDAEDVVQESFLSIWRSASTYRSDRNSGRSWLLSIVHHRTIDKLRGRQSRIQGVELEEGINTADAQDVLKEVINNLVGSDVQSALEQLPPDQRKTIELAYFRGYTHTQIAELMQVPLGTVKGRMRIGLHKLRALLESMRPEVAHR